LSVLQSQVKGDNIAANQSHVYIAYQKTTMDLQRGQTKLYIIIYTIYLIQFYEAADAQQDNSWITMKEVHMIQSNAVMKS